MDGTKSEWLGAAVTIINIIKKPSQAHLASLGGCRPGLLRAGHHPHAQHIAEVSLVKALAGHLSVGRSTHSSRRPTVCQALFRALRNHLQEAADLASPTAHTEEQLHSKDVLEEGQSMVKVKRAPEMVPAGDQTT